MILLLGNTELPPSLLVRWCEAASVYKAELVLTLLLDGQRAGYFARLTGLLLLGVRQIAYESSLGVSVGSVRFEVGNGVHYCLLGANVVVVP